MVIIVTGLTFNNNNKMFGFNISSRSKKRISYKSVLKMSCLYVSYENRFIYHFKW